jgi:hypothetical protein
MQPDYFIGGTNPSLGGVIDMTVFATDFIIGGNLDHFFICPETASPIVVILMDGNSFTITAVQANAYLGRFIPIAIKKVIKVGTTGLFSFGY